jgi:uncharacterized protein (TIGR02145 family)
MPSTAVTLTARFEAEIVKPSAGEVLVGSLYWAKSNLSGNNTFATNEYDYGALFIFGSSTVYSYSGGTTPPSSNSATSWTTANDPCPDGWHVPTETEITAMLNAATAKTWTTSGSSNGMRYTVPNGTLFLPAAGFRYYNGATSQGSYGYYWSSTYDTSSSSYYLYFDSGNTGTMYNYYAYVAQSVRCVRPYIEPSPAGEVEVGDVVWAKSNLSGNNTFATNEYDYGALFLYGSSTAYSYSGGTTPPSSNSATTWPTANDPCPDGWHVPTETEMQAMLNAATAKTWTTSGSINGMRYTVPNGTMFLPAAGSRNSSGGGNQGTYGYYWSSTYDGTNGRGLYFFSSNTGTVYNAFTFNGYSVRCVRPQ